MRLSNAVTLAVLWAASAACAAPTSEEPAQTPAPLAARGDRDFLTATIVPPIPPAPSPTLEGPLAEVVAWVDMGAGSAAFDAMVYGQDVTTGATYKSFMSVGDHHAEAVRRKDPVSLLVRAPGTYVFYARLTYVPELYHWGYTGCPALTDCPGAVLKAIDVVADGVYEIVISDRQAELPEAGVPVSAPWSY